MSIVIMLILLSILILVHEAGHFLAAKMFKMRVDKFGFGLPIGPTLWQKKFGETTVLIHAFLLGGYVAFPDDDKENPLPANSQDRFLNRPIYQRFIVVSAGVFANIVCAFVLVLMTAFLWGQMPSGKYDVFIKNIVAEKNQSVWQSGLEKGDKILSVNGIDADSTVVLTLIAKMSAQNDGKVEREFAQKNLEELKKLNPTLETDVPLPFGTIVKLPEKLDEAQIVPDEKTAKGFKRYDDLQVQLTDRQKKLREEFVAEGAYVPKGDVTLEDIAYAYSDGRHPVYLKVLRDGKEIELNPLYPNEDGLIGVELEIKELLIPTKSVKSAFVTSGKYLYEQTYMLLYGLYQIFAGKIPLKDLHGIVAITKVGGDIIQNNGIFYGLLLTAIISLDLAIVNFLPIPALDGGHVVFLLIEKLRGKPLDEETVNKIGTAGFLFLIALMILVVFNDIYALIMQKL